MLRLWLLLGIALLFPPPARALGGSGDAAALEPAFQRVNQDVGPAVVSISTLSLRSVGRVRFYSPEGLNDPLVEEFFRQYFGMAPQQQIQVGVGSGFIFDAGGYVLTNEHVVRGAHEIEVVLSDGRKFRGEVTGADERSDLAVIRIPGENLPTAKLGDSSGLRIGQWALALGNPLGFMVRNPQPSLTVGVISALHQSLVNLPAMQGRYYGDLIQTDAAINIGNSGGPLVNVFGEVIGINTLIYSTSGGNQGIGFAIPINRAKAVLQDLTGGKAVPYPWLGAWVQSLTPDIAGAFGASDRTGALVFKLVANGPAHRGGLRPGDIVRGINGQEVLDGQDLTDKILACKPGQQILLRLWREGKEIEIGFPLGNVGPRPAPAVKPKIAAKKAAANYALRGLVVRDISEEWARKGNLASREGVLVMKVEKDSPAAKAGLRPGDIVDQIAGRYVRNEREFRAAMQNAKGKILAHTDKGYVVLEE